MMKKSILFSVLLIITISLSAGIDQIFFENCNYIGEWSVVFNGDNDPDVGNVWDTRSYSPFEGADGEFIWTNVDPYNPEQGDYAVTSSYILSPQISIPEHDQVIFSFDHDFHNGGYDNAIARIKVRNSAGTHSLQTISDNEECHKSFDITSYTSGYDWIKIIFDYYDIFCPITSGIWMIDNIDVTSIIPDPSPEGALSFDGNDMAAFGTYEIYGDYCVETWFKTEESSIMQSLIAGNRFFYTFYNEFLIAVLPTGEVLYEHISSDYQVATIQTYNDSEWHHLAAMRDGNNLKLVLDGNQTSASFASIPDFSTSTILLAGSYLVTPAFCLTGELDEVRFWSNNRSLIQIRENMNLTVSVTANNLFGYYQFNEGSGSELHNLVDLSSGNLNTVTRIESDAPFGKGNADYHLFSFPSSHDFSQVDFSLSVIFLPYPQGITASLIDVAPNLLPDAENIIPDQYWIIHPDNANLIAHATFIFPDNIPVEDEARPQIYELYHRNTNSISNWSQVAVAGGVDSNSNTVFFPSLDGYGQYMIHRATPLPEISVNPTSYTETLYAGETLETQLYIENTGIGNLDYNILISNPSARAKIRDSGGPDNFGYTWIDSDEAGGPVYDWFDISSLGMEIITNGDLTGGDQDDGFKTINLPFSFPFYGIAKNSVKISSNGYLTFGSNAVEFINTPIPENSDPNDIIAPLWTDLDPGFGGNIYYYYDAVNSKFFVQYSGIPHINPGSIYTFQTVIYETGDLYFQYQDLSGFTDNCTVGIENSDGIDGLQVVFNATYLHNNLTIKFNPGWLSLDSYSGTLLPDATEEIEVYIDASGLAAGDYSRNIVISSNDPDEPEVIVPVTLNVIGTLDPPQNVTVEIIGTDVQISWDAVSGANFYKIYSSNDPYESYENWDLEAEGISGLLWSQTIPENKKYYYVVASTDEARSDINSKISQKTKNRKNISGKKLFLKKSK